MRNQRGMSLIEAMLASVLTTMVIGGVLTMLTSMQVTNIDLQDRSAARQGLRMAMSWIQRDLTMAGVGLTPMTPVFPLVLPRDGGGLTIRYNTQAITDLIQGDTAGRTNIVVPTDFGGRVGDYVIVYDSTGGFDLTLVQEYDPGTAGLVVAPAMGRDYLVSDGTAIARVEQIEYWLDGTNLMRRIDADAAQLIAQAVTAFTLRYFNDEIPPAEFTPTTAASQMRIRVIEVLLRTETERDQLQTGERPPVELRTRISPRPLSISRS